MRYYLYHQLRERGIKYSREHIRRLENQRLFPMHFDLDDAGRRIAWEATLIDRYQAAKEKKARANAKAARKATTPPRKAKAKDRADRQVSEGGGAAFGSGADMVAAPLDRAD